MKLRRVLFTALFVLGGAAMSVRPALAQLFVDPPLPGDFFVTHYYDVATSTSPSASGYGGNGASGGIGDGLVRIVNGGDIATQQRGTICAYIWVFDDIEEMQACCGCPVTPDGLRTMSVINNLTKNFGVNRGNLNAGVIDLAFGSPNLFLPKPVPLPAQIGALGSSGWVCDPSFQFGPTVGVTAHENSTPMPNVRAWMTNTEGNSPVPAASGLVKGTSVSEFQPAGRNLASDEVHSIDLADFCFFLITNGSGSGACSCGSGDDFSKVAQPIVP